MPTGFEHAALAYQLGAAHAEAAALVGARFLWPDGLAGDGVPCTCSPLTNASKITVNGESQFADSVVTVSAAAFGETRPRENQACRLKPGPNEGWARMKIISVEVMPGGQILQLGVNSFSQGSGS